MKKQSLDSFSLVPGAKTAYLSNYGWHFSKKAADFAISKMKRKNNSGNLDKVEAYTKEQLTNLLNRYGVKLENDVMYDAVYVAAMCKADFYGTSIIDEMHLALYVKDVIDDPDAADGTIMRRWYAGMVANGEPVDWEEIL